MTDETKIKAALDEMPKAPLSMLKRTEWYDEHLETIRSVLTAALAPKTGEGDIEAIVKHLEEWSSGNADKEFLRDVVHEIASQGHVQPKRGGGEDAVKTFIGDTINNAFKIVEFGLRDAPNRNDRMKALNHLRAMAIAQSQKRQEAVEKLELILEDDCVGYHHGVPLYGLHGQWANEALTLLWQSYKEE